MGLFSWWHGKGTSPATERSHELVARLADVWPPIVRARLSIELELA